MFRSLRLVLTLSDTGDLILGPGCHHQAPVFRGEGAAETVPCTHPVMFQERVFNVENGLAGPLVLNMPCWPRRLSDLSDVKSETARINTSPECRRCLVYGKCTCYAWFDVAMGSLSLLSGAATKQR